MNTKSQKVLGVFLASISIFFWGITFVSTKYLLNSFSPVEILFYRFIAAYIGLWLIRPKFEKIAAKDNILFALAALTGVVLYQFTENIAIHFTNASNVSVIVSICPLFTAIISQLVLKEKHINRWFIIGFIISISGVTLVCFNGNTELEFNPKGDLLALTSGICWGFYSLFISVTNKRKYDPVCATRRIFFFSVLLMIPLSLISIGITKHTGMTSLTSSASDLAASMFFSFGKSINAARFSNPFNWLNLLFLGIVASGLCFTAWNKACNITGTVKVNCGIYLIPVVTIIFAFFILGEKITLLGAIGALITITGLFISEKTTSDV